MDTIITPEELAVKDLYNKMGGVSQLLTALASIFLKAAAVSGDPNKADFKKIAALLKQAVKVIEH